MHGCLGDVLGLASGAVALFLLPLSLCFLTAIATASVSISTSRYRKNIISIIIITTVGIVM